MLDTTPKVIAFLIVILALLVGVSTYASRYVVSTSRDLENHIIQIENSTRDGQWEKAEENLSRMEEDWARIRERWIMLIDHIEVDAVELALARVSSFVETREKNMALAEISGLRGIINGIPQRDHLKIGNIF